MQNNKIYYSILFLFVFACADNSNPLIPNNPNEEITLDILTWNIEHYPKNSLTNYYLVELIDSLNVDIIALQEIENSNSLNELANELPNWDPIIGPSHYGQRNAYLINTESINYINDYEILTNITNEPFTKFPFVLEFSFLDTEFIIINNHFKCCGDGSIDYGNYNDEEYRRLYAIQLIKNYLDENHHSDNVIVLGDLNDELIDNENVFELVLDDYENYLFTDYEIALGSEEFWSFPSWPSHLDHIWITNELFPNHVNTETILIENYLENGLSAYEQYISDHRPVLLQLSIQPQGE